MLGRWFCDRRRRPPYNEGRGYVIRRILRRAARFGRKLDLHEPFLYKLVPVVVECLGEAFPEIRERAEYVATVIQSEEAGFGRTLDRGLEIFNTAASRTAETKTKTLSGDDAFQLYDTFGFPPDLTQLLAREKGLNVDVERFDELMKEQKVCTAQKTDSHAGGTGGQRSAGHRRPAQISDRPLRRQDPRLDRFDRLQEARDHPNECRDRPGAGPDLLLCRVRRPSRRHRRHQLRGRAWRGRPALASRGHLGLASPAVSVRRRQRARARCPRHRPLRR